MSQPPIDPTGLFWQSWAAVSSSAATTRLFGHFREAN